MAVPLILALAGTALDQMGRTAAEREMIETQLKQKREYQQALEREKELQRERDRIAAMERYFKATATPAGVGREIVEAQEFEPDLSKSQMLSGLGKLAQQLGAYYAQSPEKNPGSKRYYPRMTESALGGRFT